MEHLYAFATALFSIPAVITLFSALLIGLLLGLRRSSHEQAVVFSITWPEQIKADWRGQELLDPSIRTNDAGRESSIQCYCPASGQLLGYEIAASTNGIDRAIYAARDAQVEWARTTFAQRRRVLRTLLAFILRHQDEIARVACLDTGKTPIDALFGEVLVTCAKLQWTLSHGEAALRSESRSTSLLMFYKRNTVRYEPLGVVGACVSWNYPFHNLLGPVISALFAGNAIVVKGSEQTAWSSKIFCAIIGEALAACGHSRDLVKSITCWPETAEHFTSHPGIAHLTFIGSRPVAHKVCVSAAKSLTPVVVELGGKDAAIVLDDVSGRAVSNAEMDRVASILMRGVFQSAGQNCVGIERIIAMPLAYDRLVSILTRRIAGLRLGNSLAEDVDVGAMISAASFDHLESLVADAVKHGATLVHGGYRMPNKHSPKGHYFAPTLLTDVTRSMHIAQQEVFAPICTVMRAESLDDAIAISNSTAYALGASVFGPTNSASNRVALEKVTSQVHAGMVAVNDFAAYYMVQLPFGGVKHSGYGRFAGAEGLRGLCNVKSVCVDRWPGWISTSIPSGLDYPIKTSAWGMGRGMVEMFHALGWKGRWNGLVGLLQAMTGR